MKAFDVVSDQRTIIVETYFRKNNLLVEGICKNLTKEQRVIVEGIYKEFRPLIEATLTPDQISKIFTDIEANATASGNNRTAIGQAKDVAAAGIEKSKEVINAVDNIINKAGKWIQDTTPVKAFDQKFEDLKRQINTKFPDSKILDGISKMGMWAKENPGKTAAIIGVLTALASLAGGPIGGAIAGQVLRGANELLKGEKLSTAIGKGIKTAALGYLSGKAFELIGDYVADMRADSIPFGPKDAGLEQVSYGATKTLSAPGMEYTQTVKGFNVAVFPQEQEGISAAMQMIRNGEPGGFDALQKIAKEIRSPDYKAAIKDVMAGARSAQLDNDSLLQWIKGISQAGQAISQGAVAASGAKKESIDLSTKDIKRIFEWCNGTPSTVLLEGPMDTIKGALGKAGTAISNKASQVGKNLTTKITADKLTSAWKAANSPTDSDQIADILRKAGVSDQVLSAVYKSMKLKLPPAAPSATTNSADKQTLPPGKTSNAAASTASPNVDLDYKALQSAVSQLRSRDAASLVKYIDGLSLGSAKTAASTQSSAIGNMASQLTTKPVAKKTSTGGTVTTAGNTTTHTADPNNPNAAPADTPTPAVAFPAPKSNVKITGKKQKAKPAVAVAV